MESHIAGPSDGLRVSKRFDGLPLTERAIAFARATHAGQRRDAGDAPFEEHPIEVAALLREAGYPDHVVATGALHEVLEDTEVDKDELDRRFGPEVAQLVDALSDDPEIEDQRERRAALRLQVQEAGETAAVIFAADKVSKVRELRIKAERGPLGEEDRAKLEHYEESLDMLSAALPGTELVEALKRELGALRAEL